MRWILPLGLSLAASVVAAPKENCEALRQHARFAAYFERVELDKLAQTVADATCKTFIIGENVKGKISLIGPENGRELLSADEFYAAFVAALDTNGLAIAGSGRFFRIVEKAKAKGHRIPLIEDGSVAPQRDEMVTRIIRARYVELDALKALLSQFVSPGADVVAFPPDILIVSDLGTNLGRLERLVANVDVEKRTTESLRLIQVNHAEAKELADEVQRLYAPKGPKSTEVLTVTTDERTNRLIVWATPWTMAQVASLVEALDIAAPSQSRAHVFKLVNSEAKEIAANLEALVGARGHATAGGAAAGVTTSEVKISANDSMNALVIVASPGDYRNLVDVIRELDAPRRQVFIEAVIMEVNAERDTELGVSGHVVLNVGGLPIALGSEPSGAASSLALSTLASSTGLIAGTQGAKDTVLSSLLGFSIAKFGLTLQAVQTDSDVNVLSTPHILTTDNKEAEITVGQRIPFQSGVNPQTVASLLSTGNANSASTLTSLGTSVTRERVELKLIVKPHIGEGDTVRLDLNQQAEELAGENSLGPITSTRGQKTTIIARDEETVVLGGIMQDRVIESVSKTPVLGDIPLLGNLFRHTSKKKVKVNLLVFITPHLVRDPSDVRRILERKQEERARAMEQLYGRVPGFEVPVDFARKRGPLAALGRTLAVEAQRPENGGEGAPGETIVAPARDERPRS